MRTIYLLSVWTHILAAAVWIGGMVFLALVLVPAVRRSGYQGAGAGLIRWTGRRFRWIGWASLILLVLTGTFNLAYRGYGWADVLNGALWQGSFGRTLGVKLLLVAVVFVMSAVHDFVIGPRAAQMMARNPDAVSSHRMRRAASWFGRINLVLALIIVMLGVMLVRGGLV